MEVIIKNNKLLIITETTIIYFDLPKKFENNLMHETDFSKKLNRFLAKHTWKTELINYFPNRSRETIFMNIVNVKTNEPHIYS